MTLLEYLRGRAFWAIDAFRGGEIKKDLQLLHDIENGDLSEKQIACYLQAQLCKLLKHCVDTVPAYKECAVTLNSCNPIDNWPVVNKAIIKKGGDQYLSSRFDKSKLIAMSTSGSTGTPFTSWQNLSKKRHVNAEVLHYNGKAGYKIGRRIIYFRSIVSEVSKSLLTQFLQNICLIDCTDLSDNSIKTKLAQIKKLSGNGGAMILSYASTLDAFRRYFDKYGNEDAKTCNIYGIVSGSEMLQDVTRKSLTEAFGCKVFSRYANEENGFLGQDMTINNVFLHNRANYYIEILKLNSDEPATLGEIGRIVVTDLYNYAMPMVRYDTGDVGAWQEISIDGVKRKAIGQFGGRKVDMIFDCNGNAISPFTITNNMWKYKEIKQFQFIQLDKCKYLLRINTDAQINQDDLLCTYKGIVGNDAKINIEICDEIPVLASGKRRYIINQMQNISK